MTRFAWHNGLSLFVPSFPAQYGHVMSFRMFEWALVVLSLPASYGHVMSFSKGLLICGHPFVVHTTDLWLWPPYPLASSSFGGSLDFGCTGDMIFRAHAPHDGKDSCLPSCVVS
jgi:hypothetical protein